MGNKDMGRRYFKRLNGFTISKGRVLEVDLSVDRVRKKNIFNKITDAKLTMNTWFLTK